jgi:hypothetical protein
MIIAKELPMIDIWITLIQTGGLGVFFYFLIKGLYKKIEVLNDVVNIQKQTLETMDKRIQETEKVGNIYKKLLEDLPKDLESYKAIINKTKDQIILELSNQNEVTEKKLRITEEKIKNSGETDIVINKYLKAIKILLGKYELDESGEKDFNLMKCCEHSKHDIEECVKLLFLSTTVEDFLNKIGFNILVYNKNTEIKNMSELINELVAKRIFFWACCISEFIGWYAIYDDEIYLDEKRFNRINNEFNLLKRIEPV